MTIAFIGDIHRDWDSIERGLAGLSRPPDAAVLLGDIECHQPLDQVATPLLDRGIDVHWIFGNHDHDGGPPMWANLVDPTRNPRTKAGALHGRVVEIQGLRVAGLGGTFSARVWHPPSEPRLHRREELEADLGKVGPRWRAGHLAAMAQSLVATAIWPADYEALAEQRADILVTHEAPASHPAGHAALDVLARRMGATLVVHGHHHVTYRAKAADGLCVMGVAAGWCADHCGNVLWQGEPPRRMADLRDGWSLEGDSVNR